MSKKFTKPNSQASLKRIVKEQLTLQSVESEHKQATESIIQTQRQLIEDLQSDIKILTEENASLKGQHGSAQREIEGLRQQLTYKDTQHSIDMDHVRRNLADCLSAKGQLQADHLKATEYMQELESKVYKANKMGLELLQSLKDAEVEIETLKQYVIDLKSRIAVYIPVRDDQTDRKLAEYINNYPDRNKLKIMFMRESEGVYQFGSKRVAVKVEKDKINIRVGGGHLSIDEFID